LGAIENYLIKADRGRANREASSFDMGYWAERNFNQDHDNSLRALDSSALRAQLMDDPILSALHARAFAWRKARFAVLMQSQEWRALYGRLRMGGPSRPLSAQEAREITQHVPNQS
jgi:hypothetical protein